MASALVKTVADGQGRAVRPPALAGWVCLVIALSAGSALAIGGGSIVVRSEHQQRIVDGDAFFLLLPMQMMELRVHGPIPLGLRLRQVLTPGRQPAPVDLTVVRDDAEQGTVRFRVPAATGDLSGEVFIRIDVPAGQHTYRLLVSGPESGVVLLPLLGPVASGAETIVATPGGARAVEPVFPRLVPKTSPKVTALPAPPAPDELGPVLVAARAPESPQTYRIESQPEAASGPRLHCATWTAVSMAGVLLLGGSALAISSSVQAGRAEREPIQVDAGAYFDRAERSSQASAVLFCLAGAAIVTAIVLELTVGPDEAESVEPGVGLIRW